MIHSMTGFSARQLELPQGVFSFELRSVNHRYLDIQLRLPDELRLYEPMIREAFSGKLLRGKVECRITFTPSINKTSSLALNHDLLEQLFTVSHQIKTLAPHTIDLSMGELLRWPGVLISNTLPLDTLQTQLLDTLHLTLQDFIDSRAREGEKLSALIQEKMIEMENLLTQLQVYLPTVIDQYQDKLKQRFLEILQTLDEERIRQEMVLFAQKIDVEEELDRLKTHLKEVKRVLSEEKKGAGKRLDFLMQELNREANTLGAKSVSAQTSQIAVQLKVYIEQMREQVQNIE